MGPNNLIAAIVGVENLPEPLFLVVVLAFLSQSAIHPMFETCLIAKARKLVLMCLCTYCQKRNRSLSPTNDMMTKSTSFSIKSILKIKI